MLGSRVVLYEARTVRGLMLITTVACLFAGGAKLWMRRIIYLQIAEAHASRVFDYGENRENGCWKDEFLEKNSVRGTRLNNDFAVKLDALRDHFANLERKYRAAASCPWFAVQPDPPAP